MGFLVVALATPAFAMFDYQRKKPITKEYKGMRRRGMGGENERRRLLEVSQELRDRADELRARADLLDERGKDEAADDIRDRADQLWSQARRLEEKADELRLPPALKRGGPRRSVESAE